MSSENPINNTSLQRLDVLNSPTLISDIYAFLLESIPAFQVEGLKTIPIQVTCFDVNHEVIVFGSNVGTMFVYKRRTKVDDTAHFVTNISRRSILKIHLISSGLVCIASNNQIIVWDIPNNLPIYGQAVPLNEDCDTYITTIAVSPSQESDSFCICSGHSDGKVFRHSIDLQEKVLIFNEKSSEIHTHEIVQVEIVSDNLYLISTCHRSVIVTQNNDSQQPLQIGQNERKSCGSYGAVHIGTDDLIYAARPRMHLVRADLSSGQVLETFVLKKAAKPKPLEVFNQFKKSTFDHDVSIQLGLLIVLNSSSILSWTANSIVVLSIDGSLIANESNLITISDVRCIRYLNEEFEVFILFKTRQFVRLRNFNHEHLVGCQLENGSDYMSCDEDYNDPFTDLNFQLPFKLPTLGAIEENLKQVIQNLQNKVAADSGYGLDNSERTENYQVQIEPEYLKEGALSDNHNDSLIVVRKKVKKKKKKTKSIFSQEDAISATTSNTLSSETSSISSSSGDKTDASEGQCNTVHQEGEHINDKDKLAMILAAFPSEHELEMSLDVRECESTMENNANLDITLTPDVIEPEKCNEAHNHDNHLNDEESGVEEARYQLLIPQNPYKFGSNVNKTYIKWNLIYSPITSNDLVSFKSSLISASGFSDESNEGAFLLFGFNDSNNKMLVTFPGFKKVKLPRNNIKMCAFSASPTKIILLDEEGNLYVANDWLHPRFLLGVKWDKVNTSRTGSRLVDTSCNIIDQICWFIDDDGSSWVYRLKSSTWILSRHDQVPSVRLKMVTISPQNSAIVWALDVQNQIYAREGIFNDKSDMDCLIAGIDWVLVEPVAGTIKLMSASLDCLWVVSEVNGEDRLFKRTGIDPPSNYVGNEWEEVLLPLLIEDQVMRISCSLSGDVYLLTANGLLYQYCIHETIPLKAVDDGWLLL